MKLSFAIISRTVLFQTIAFATLSSLSASDESLRGSGYQNKTQTLENVECTLFLKISRLSIPEEEKILTEEKWTCELDNPNQTEYFGIERDAHTTLDVKGIENNVFKSQGTKSGHSRLFASEVIVGGSNDDPLFEISPTAHVQIFEDPDDPGRSGRRGFKRELVTSSGTLKTLVVRVIAKNGAEPTADISQLRSDVFEDRLCLKSQYEACSHGRLKIEPFHGTTATGQEVNGGVVNVKISIDPSDGNRDKLETKARERATEIYGELSSQFDLVMFCIPPGTGDWIAYAYINRFDSYFNDKWCSSVSTQVHEVGHNLGLAHSGEGSSSYGDQSGMMGFSYEMDDAPEMCFNPAKNYQLGWYIEQQKFLNPLTDILAKTKGNNRQYILNGVDDFQFGRDDSEDKLISLRLKQQNSREDYYIGFNRKTGMNSETMENANTVLIVKKTGGPIEYGQSWKVSILSAIGDSYTIENFDGSSFHVTIELLSIVGKDAKINVLVTNAALCDQVFDSYELKYKNKRRRGCGWVAKRKGRRCSKSWKKQLLSDWCPRTCGSCPDTASVNKIIFDDNN